MKLGVVLSFFSPCGYALPKRHFAATLKWLASQDVLVAVTQAVLPGKQPEPVPVPAQTAVFGDCDLMFYKECLWNRGAELLPQCDQLVFLDGDITLSDGWIGEVQRALADGDVCQPFERARWLDAAGQLIDQKFSCAAAIESGLPPYLGKYHSGFGVGITRQAFESIGGFYDLLPAGGGDAAFWLSMSGHPATQSIIDKKASGDEVNIGCRSFAEYRSRVRSAGLTVRGVKNVIALHAWHGDRANRRYTTRERFFPKGADGEPLVFRRPDGLLKFSSPAPLAQAYFTGRLEDG